MFKKISLTMAVVYGLIIIAAITTLDLMIILNYKQDQLDKNQAKHVMFAEIISNIARNNLDNTMELNGTIRENSTKLDGRVLVINNENKVLADNFAYYIGKVISVREVEKVKESNEQVVEYYKVDDTNIMIVTVPILINNKVQGTVLVSAYIDHILKDVQDLANLIIGVSLLACIVAIYLSFILGRKLSRPIEELTAASEEILMGNLNTKVSIVRQDEIGKLAETFNKMSEELYKTDSNRRRFISDVSHELKTPLTSIKALIESLIDGNNEISTYKEYLGDINGEIDRLSLMVKSLLTVTRLEEMELKREFIDLNEEVSAMVKLFAPLAEQSGIKLVNNCQNGIAVEADRAKFKEVLINLVDNSIKYGKQNGFVELGCRRNDEMIELYVKDDGWGIPDEDVNSIFDIFYRVDESRNRKTGGSGIGLYIVKRIIELHGWSVRVKSKLGEGTEFIIGIGSSI